MSSTSSPFGQNEWLVEEMYRKFRDDPSSVDESWHEFLVDYNPEPTTDTAATGNGAPTAPAPRAATPAAAPAPVSPAEPAPAPAPAKPAPLPARTCWATTAPRASATGSASGVQTESLHPVTPLHRGHR